LPPPLRLRQGAEPRYSFGFFRADVQGVCDAIKARGIEIITTSDVRHSSIPMATA